MACCVTRLIFSSAYLNADIEGEVYVEQPKGYEVMSQDGKKLVCRLNRSLYGLRQSGRMWNNLLSEFLSNQGYHRSLADPCLYTKHIGKNKILILVWVDDLIIAASNSKLMSDIKSSLSDAFSVKDLGVLNYFLGINFQVNDDNIIMSQTKYVSKMLDKFDMSECKPKSMPCEIDVNNILREVSEPLDNPKLFRAIVGSLIYVMTCTRPDLCYVVTMLSQHMANPKVIHLSLAKHVLRYLKGTINYGLTFSRVKDVEIIGFTDSDWGSSPDRRSISGYCYTLNSNGPLISWSSRKQRIVALSSSEAEYVAMTEAMKEANFLRQLLADMTGSERQVVRLYADNQSAIKLAENPCHHKKSKHIDIRYHFIRQEIADGIVNVKYIPTNDNVADMFTKPLSKTKILNFKMIYGLKV